ncbi:hypothetical protein MUTS16_63650 [Escherichia coli]|nr:hypothetical protein MUTS16_63650 [Escherichia coli]
MIWQLTDDKRWSALRQRFSWVEEMHHTPQDPEHHGEGDVGVHTEMVLNALITLPEFQQLPLNSRKFYGRRRYCMMLKSAALPCRKTDVFSLLVMLVGAN